MAENKHMPGPWRVGYKSLHVFADNAKIGGGAMVCEVRGWGYLTGNGHGALGLTPEEAAAIQDANARLIASAPDLLDALILFVTEYVDLVKSGDAGFWDAEKEGKVIKARAAIAKAEGRS